MKRVIVSGVLVLGLLTGYVVHVQASGPVGLYAVVEKVISEPTEQGAERIQVWGAFAFVDGGIQSGRATSAPQRGYLYFTVKPDRSAAEVETIRKEWADLKAVAGTGQAVAFGAWGYMGPFAEVNEGGIYAGSRGAQSVLRVSKQAQTPPVPVSYSTARHSRNQRGIHRRDPEKT